MLPVYQSVLRRRMQLAQRYSRGCRYLPPGSIQAFIPLGYQRRRFHDFAIVPSVRSGIRYRDSALEFLTQCWNRLPREIIGGNSNNIMQRLDSAAYQDNEWDVSVDMRASILTL